MYSKKNFFFLIFFEFLLVYCISIMSFQLNNILNLNNFSSLFNILLINSNLFIIFILFLILISYLNNSIILYTFKESLFLITFSFILSFGYFYFFEKISFNLFFNIFYFYIIFLIYYFFNYNFKNSNFFHYCLNSFFIMILFSFLLLNYLFIFDNNLNSSTSSFNNFLINNNLVVLDILNSNKEKILKPYLKDSFELGYNSGYLNSCFKNSIKNCSFSKKSIDYKVLFSNKNLNNSSLFNKHKYTSFLINDISKTVPAFIIKYFYLFYITLVLIILSFFSPLFLFLFNFVWKRFIKFFSWFFDPFGIYK